MTKMIIIIIKRIFLIFHKLIIFYEYLMTMIFQEYNFFKNSIYFLKFIKDFMGVFQEIKISKN